MEYATRQFLPEETRKMMIEVSLLPKKKVLEYLKYGNFMEQEGAVKSAELSGEDLDDFLFEKERGLVVHEPTVLIAAMQNPNLSEVTIRKIATEATHPIVQLYALDKLDDNDHVKVNLLTTNPSLEKLKDHITTSPQETWF